MSYEMKQKAIQHSTIMEKHYGRFIDNCIKNSKIYDTDFKLDEHIANENMNFSLLNIGSVEAIQHTSDTTKVALLNFASYKNPGGGFLHGMISQEECLCHDSYLFNILVKFMDYYKWNREHLNKGLYLNRAIYSPNVYFTKVNRNVDVITCAAPNLHAQSFSGATKEENSEALKSRIKFILDIAEDNKIDTLILGAFGCGVFRQNPREVASIFIEECKKRNFKNIIFPIIDLGYNYNAFQEVLNENSN